MVDPPAEGVPAQRKPVHEWHAAPVVVARADADGEARATSLFFAQQVPSSLDRVTAALLACDLVVLTFCALVAPWSHASSVALVGGVMTAFAVKSLYKSRLTLSVLDDLPVIATSVPAVVALVALSSVVTAASTEVLAHGALVLVLVVTARAATYAAIRWARSSGRVTYPTLIVGSGGTAGLLTRMLETHPAHGLRIVGLVGPRAAADAEVRRRVVEEDFRRLVHAAIKQRARVVVLTLSGAANEEILEALRRRESRVPFTLFVVPALQEMLHSPGVDRVGHIAVVRLRDPMLHALPVLLKRGFDVLVSGVAITLLAPVMALVAVAVRLEGGPGVLFTQTRVGLGGVPFVLYKFRSLHLAGPSDADHTWSAQDQMKVGPVGKFIRKTSLDELPQLFNILRGDMSLVGPRPERPHFVEEFGRTYHWYSFRHRVRPGLTGWAAVSGLRGNTSIQDRCLYDNAYIDNWSLWLDMKILVMTVKAVVRAEGS
jgi:exopolysaccharide biosynthesis polyprenyl glycosylphosphotransferase